MARLELGRSAERDRRERAFVGEPKEGEVGRGVDADQRRREAARVAPTSVTAAGVRRKTCAAVTTRPARQQTPEATAWRRPMTATVLAPTCSTMAAIRSEWAASGSLVGAPVAAGFMGA